MSMEMLMCKLNPKMTLRINTLPYLEMKLYTSTLKTSYLNFKNPSGVSSQRYVVFAATKGSAKTSKLDEKIPSWAKPDSEEPPPWAREETNSKDSIPTLEIPYFAYLLASTVTAIASIGSVFEYINKKPVFGVVYPDSVFYVPLLGFFAFTGIPTCAFLWFKAVQVANKEAEEQDRRDGFL